VSNTWFKETLYSENVYHGHGPLMCRIDIFLYTKSHAGGALIVICYAMPAVNRRSNLEFFRRICTYRNL